MSRLARADDEDMRLAPTQREFDYPLLFALIVVGGLLLWICGPFLLFAHLSNDKNVPIADPSGSIVYMLSRFDLKEKITPINPQGLSIKGFQDGTDFLTCELSGDDIDRVTKAMRALPGNADIKPGYPSVGTTTDRPGWWVPSGRDVLQIKSDNRWLGVSPSQRKVWIATYS